MQLPIHLIFTSQSNEETLTKINEAFTLPTFLMILTIGALFGNQLYFLRIVLEYIKTKFL